MREAVSLVLLALVLGAAVARPRGLPEAAIAVPAALIVLAIGAVSWSHTSDEITRLGPVIGFLAAVLALADAAAAEGLFTAAGIVLSRAARGSSQRMLAGVFALAASTTAILSLDTTVVLLTPVVAVMAHRAGVSARPHLYACTTLANAGSLLLPVSNLTNLLALAVLPISFARFAALMALPWLVVVFVTYLIYRWFFRSDLALPAASRSDGEPHVPWFALGVVVVTLVGFAVASLLDIEPVWVAGAGAAVLAGKRLFQRHTSVPRVIASSAPLFCIFVLALAVVVRAASDGGLRSTVDELVPSGHSLPTLLAIAGVGALLANVVNNLPATLLLLPVVSAAGVAPVLALLVGVNVGPNLSYPGSLATLLWRRNLREAEGVPRLGEFTRLGLATVPVSVVLAVLALWLAVRAIGVR